MAQSSQKGRKWLTLKEKLGAIDDDKAGKRIDDVAKKLVKVRFTNCTKPRTLY